MREKIIKRVSHRMFISRKKIKKFSTFLLEFSILILSVFILTLDIDRTFSIKQPIHQTTFNHNNRSVQ